MQSLKELFKIGYGPSSSHTIAPGKAAEIFLRRQTRVSSFRVTLFGSLAATGKGHATDEVIQKALLPYKVEIVWRSQEELPLHPNGMLFESFNKDLCVDKWEVYSPGGGDLMDNSGNLNSQGNVYPLSKLTDILGVTSKSWV